jgi:hypothetical protein
MEADVQEVNTQELKDRMEQIETEIEFRKQNGLDTKDLEDKQTELDLYILGLGTSSSSAEEYNGPTIWDYLDVEVTDAQLLEKIDTFLAQIQAAWDAKDWNALCGLMDAPFLDVFLASSAYFTDDKIGNLELTFPETPGFDDPKEREEWLEPSYRLLKESLQKERDAIWQKDYVAGAHYVLDSYEYAICLGICAEHQKNKKA